MATRAPNPAIAMTAPPGEERRRPHPRRPPAARSVSLLHSRSSLHKDRSGSPSDNEERSKSSRESDATDAPSSLQPQAGRDSCGETSSAEKWFEKSNNEVRDSSTTFADNDPPFFMRNASSSETPPDVEAQFKTFMHNGDMASSLPLRNGLLELGTDGSSTEDFRSVIDDLTVQNKKLKRRLKKYEKLHDSHLKDEKLFEVRIHGLPPEKKRELEETLRKFAASLDTAGANAFKDEYGSLLPLLKTSKAASSYASLPKADSAYASMSATGHGLSAQSGNEHVASQRQNIHSYLHDIPKGLLPKQNPGTLSERTKQKLVVRRLEQIFAGKGASGGGHQHSLQQQEVSHSAARADVSKMESIGPRARQEGFREAHIMDHETEDPLDLKQETAKPSQGDLVSQEDMQNVITNQADSNLTTAEQRPTRPLDLDPQRAQVPAENFRYLRSLGFSPPDLESNRSPEVGHGWIYLNFLINMAQLHTINVTSDFVRKALGELSDKFEISDDGHRVRWKGGNSVTRTSSSGGGSSNERPSDDTPDGRNPRKRIKLAHDGSAGSSTAAHLSSGNTSQWQRLENNKHTYTPLFFHRESSDETDESSSSEEEEDDSMSTGMPAPVVGNSSAATERTSSGIRTTSGLPGKAMRKKQKHDDGPIIFYNNVRFCTDLSGDRWPGQNYNSPAYTRASSVPVGKHAEPPEIASEKRGPLEDASELPEPMNLSDNPIPESMELNFPPRSPPDSESSKEQSPIGFEASGIGGVWPADNFTVSVESRHARTENDQEPNTAPKRLPTRLAQALHGNQARHKTQPRMEKKVTASHVHELPPSELPPAISFIDPDDESEDDESEADESMSDSAGSAGGLPPSAAPQPLGFPYASTEDDDEEEDSEDDDEESDGEVDFLAAARQVDPEAVRQKEREYDANMAERLAEEIPAGSSAATAGGGSGFASLINASASKELRGRLSSLKREGTDESMAVNMPNAGSSDSDESSEGLMSDIKS